MVQSKLCEFNIPSYQEYRYHDRIMNICSSLFETGDVGFKEIDSIPIYEGELKVVDGLDSDRKKKLMFTFYALARYMDCDGWINKKTAHEISEVFRLANVNVTTEVRNTLLHELYDDGYIGFAKRIDNLNIQVKPDPDGDVGYRIKEFNDLGYQYIGNFKDGYKQCELCGRPVKAGNNKKKYCPQCAKLIQAEQNKEWQKANRNSKIQKIENRDFGVIFKGKNTDFF